MPEVRRPYPDFPVKGAKIAYLLTHCPARLCGAGLTAGSQLLLSTEGQMQVSAGQTKPVKVYWPIQATSNLRMAGRRTGGLHVSNIHTMCQADIFSVSTQCDIL